MQRDDGEEYITVAKLELLKSGMQTYAAQPHDRTAVWVRRCTAERELVLQVQRSLQSIETP